MRGASRWRAASATSSNSSRKGRNSPTGIEDIARYYRTYVELMDDWDAVLPGRVLRVQHEDVVDDLEGNVRRHPRLLRPSVRGGLRGVPQDQTQRAHAEFGTGAPADFPRRA